MLRRTCHASDVHRCRQTVAAVATAVAMAAVRPVAVVRRRNRRREDRQVLGQVGRVHEGAQSPSSADDHADDDAACQSHRTKGSARADELAMKRAGHCQKRAGQALISRYHGRREPAHSVRNRA